MKRNDNKTLASFRISKAVGKRLRELSRRTGVTQTRLVENALRDYLSRATIKSA